MSDLRELAFAALASTAAIGAAALTRKLLSTAYNRVADEEPPRNPAAEDHLAPCAAVGGALRRDGGHGPRGRPRGAAAAWSAALDESAPVADR